MKVYLQVPFKDIEIAKQRGARFDGYKKMWYIEDHPSMYWDKRVDEWKHRDHPFMSLFGEWFSDGMKKPTTSEPLKRPPFKVVQPRTPRKKNNKRRK
jgi:hypothetical protein